MKKIMLRKDYKTKVVPVAEAVGLLSGEAC